MNKSNFSVGPMGPSHANRLRTETSPSFDSHFGRNPPVQTYSLESLDYDASIDYGQAAKNGLQL
jgi:hypothetical protein